MQLRQKINSRFIIAGVIGWLAIGLTTGDLAFSEESPLLKAVTSEKPEPVKELTEDDVEKNRQILSAELDELEKRLKDEQQLGDDSVVELKSELEKLQDLELVLEQQNTALGRKASLKIELANVAKSNPLKNISSAKTNSFIFLENLRGQVSLEKLKFERAKRAIAGKQTALATSQSTAEELRKERRKLKDTFDRADRSIAAELGLIEIGIRKAEADIVLRRIQLQNSKLEKEIAQARLELFEKQLGQLSKTVRFDDEVLEEALKDISSREQLAKKEKEEARASLAKIGRRELSVKKLVGQGGERESNAKLELGILSKIKENIAVRVDILDRLLSLFLQEKQLWRQRVEFHSGQVERSRRKSLVEHSASSRKELTEELKLDELKLSQFRKELISIESRISGLGSVASMEAKRLNEYRQNIFKTRDVHEQYVDEVERLKRLHESLESELSQGLSQLSLTRQLKELWGGVVSIWSFELTSIDDHPITVNKLFFALVLFILGYIVSKSISRQLRRRLLPRLKLADGVAAALESLTFYILVLVFALFALKVVHIPLTIFTLLGGAIAIGVGFGSQNLINNFISGLILLLEQPIRVGDLIEVDTLTGKVERIGLRSTMVRTGDNIDVLVPNSSFLQKHVVNWTLGDDRVRIKVRVGVVYGSPTDKVTELLLKSVNENKKVLKTPEPQVWFVDFGDNALIFDVLFWARVRSTSEKSKLQSEVRYVIDSLFREADLIIAFPQRDIHIDSLRPIQVQMVEGQKG